MFNIFTSAKRGLHAFFGMLAFAALGLAYVFGRSSVDPEKDRLRAYQQTRQRLDGVPPVDAPDHALPGLLRDRADRLRGL